jgi:hypothetical protein
MEVRHWWLMAVIVAAQKAEIRKIQSQLRQIVHETLS